MDGDGDLDIVSGFQKMMTQLLGMKIMGKIHHWTAADIATSADGTFNIFKLQMLIRWRFDIVSASENDDTIAWYENDGAANPSMDCCGYCN